MRLKTASLFILSLFFASYLFSQEANGKTGALLWKVSGNGLNKPSYILGTHHLMPSAYLDSIPGCRTALNSCEQVVGELVMSDMQALQAQIQQASRMPSDTTYQQLFSTDDLAFLDKKCTAIFGAGIQQLSLFKPAMISMLYSVTMLQKKYPSTVGQEGMDIAVQKQGKPVIGLETADDQIYALFGSQSLQRQADLLICSLRHEDKGLSELQKMQQCYRAADLTCLYGLLADKPADDPCPSSSEEENILNKNRNDQWMKKLPTLMKEKPSFVAVGCLHLAGPVGLLAQLEKLGYKVDAVK